jgi:hypothetical protein
MQMDTEMASAQIVCNECGVLVCRKSCAQLINGSVSSRMKTFAELADALCQRARLGTKTMNIKLDIQTAREMVEAEYQREREFRWLLALAKDWASRPDGGSARALLNRIGQ